MENASISGFHFDSVHEAAMETGGRSPSRCRWTTTGCKSRPCDMAASIRGLRLLKDEPLGGYEHFRTIDRGKITIGDECQC